MKHNLETIVHPCCLNDKIDDLSDDSLLYDNSKQRVSI